MRPVHSIQVFLSLLVVVFISCLPASGETKSQLSEPELWSAIKEGRAVAMMRHALAPGGGDPSEFEIGKCETQRNLDERGRAQAVEIGKQFRQNGIPEAQVMTSQWCRCRDTAELLAIGEPQDLTALNSFFQNRAAGPAQTKALMEFLANRSTLQPLVLVTHQVNITALTDVFPSSGEIVVFEATNQGEVKVLGSIEP